MDNQNQQLDPTVVNLAKAIRQSESGGDFSAKGASGEQGGYQFTQPTWDTYSKEFGINVPLNNATPEQQNAVAYNKIKKWKDEGKDVTQIASMWNAGQGEPNAYTGKFSNGSPSIGVNKYGVKYDVPKYVASVGNAYLTLKNGGQVGVDTNNPSSVQPTQTSAQPAQQTNTTQRVSDVVNGIGSFLGLEPLGKGLANVAYDWLAPTGLLGKESKDLVIAVKNNTATPEQLKAYSEIYGSMPSKEAVLGSAGQTALTVATAGLGSSETLAGNIGQGALLGAGTGAFGAMTQSANTSGILKGAAVGGATGGVLGGTFKVAGDLLGKVLPKRFVSGVLGKGVNEETIQYALDKGVGPPQKMLTESNQSISSLGKELGNVLAKPEYEAIVATANDLLPQIIEQYPNAGLTAEEIANHLMKIAPLQKTLIEKLASGEGLSLEELHTLNSAIGKNTFKQVFDDPAVKAGKDIASAFYHSASDFITSKIPESAQIFEDLSKEYPLNAALYKVIRNKIKSKTFTLRDLMAIIAGFSTAGPVGAGVGYLGEKALTSPTANMTTAGLLNKLSTPTAQKMGQYSGLISSNIAGQIIGK